MRCIAWFAMFAALATVACATDGDDGGGGDDDGISEPPDPPRAFVPTPTGPCPTIANGDVMFAPAGVAPRRVKLVLKDGAGPGPLVFYWHATSSSPSEAEYALGATQAALVEAGAVIAVPSSDDTAGMFEWFIVNMSDQQDDFLVADEVFACLAQAGRVDPQQVHSMGMSAGALQTTALSLLRPSYIASVATYSGGIPSVFEPPPLDSVNKFAALIFFGGSQDMVFDVDFKDAAQRYQTLLSGDGHFARLCDHGGGHVIPRDAAPAVAEFFLANGFGDWPSPYAQGGLPASFPAYCQR
jgi:predicted esterase